MCVTVNVPLKREVKGCPVVRFRVVECSVAFVEFSECFVCVHDVDGVGILTEYALEQIASGQAFLATTSLKKRQSFDA